MQKVVSNGLKIDLHIHSIVSSHKDGTKVKNNTLDNIPLLLKKLNDQNVNICSITDHDTFSYDFYVALKQAESEKNSIQKVLPGVEFSVCFFDGDRESVIHVVTIFSDEDEKKIQAIEELLRKNPPTYKLAYKEEDFLDLLRRININTILIAHQKNTLTSTKARKNDANTLGEFKFLEFVYTDYFEAFEFKNRRNEILNKAYLFQKHLENQIRFVTGTDCHDWSVYPSETPEEIISDFPYTYAKCLPTFKGLVMAITDHTRLKTVNSFFTATKYTLPSISFKHDTDDVVIPLSKGINVIIGDNSVGKSLLLHAITGYTKPTYLLPNQVKAGYRKYLAQLGLDVPKQITPEHIFCFDMQGEVRTKFEENKLNATEFLGSYFPKSIDNSALKRGGNDMKRQLSFDFENEQYILKENGQIIFSIDAQELKFVSLDFYNGVYKGKSTAIELTNAIKDDKYKKGNYIFSCLNDIITSIQDEIHEPLTETLSNEAEPAKLSKAVSLYELSACAGDGFFMDGASAPEREIKTEYLDADYAVRISGKSMEPTITDGSIVFVKHVNELNEGDIGIFLVDGNVMCKRYCLDGGEKWLRPDNESPEFNAIRIKEGMNCLLQGKVLG